MSDAESVQSGVSSSTIDVGIDGPCITSFGMHSASGHNMQISPTRTSIRTTRAIGASKAMMHNKSCDSCRVRKKKCDGLHPCSRCIEQMEQIFCHYSPRKPRKPYRRRGEGTVGALSRDREVGSRPCATRNGVRSRLRLKRCSLAPSPATGLVGLKENVFLGDYFHCLGFLSFTTQSCIRETMVRIMTSPAWGRRSEHHGSGSDGAQHHTDNATALVDSAPYSSRPKDPSMCIFWCACGLGALVRGRSVESVSSYAQIATDAMNLFCGPDTLGSTEALTILAYLNWRCGNEGLYEDYIQRVARFLQERIDVDTTSYMKKLVDVVEGVKTLKALEECMNGDKLSSFCNEDSDPPQVSEYATERDIYRFVMQSFRIYVNIFQAHVHANPCEVPFDGREGVARKGADPDVLVEGPKGQHQRGATCTSAGSTIIVSFRDEILQKLKQYYFGFGRLEEAAERILLFEKAAQDDYGGVFKRLSRFTEVFERYPGLFQLPSGTHKAHILSTAIMATEDPRCRPLYDKLRNVYNSMHPPGFRPLPPFEEWCGMSQVCDHLYCRTMEAIILSDGLTFRLPSAGTQPIGTVEHHQQHQSVYSRDVLARDDMGIVSEALTGRSEMCGTFETRSMQMPVGAAAGSLSPDVAGTDPNPNHYSRGALAEGRVITPPVSVRSVTVSPWGQDLPPADSLLLLQNVTGDNYSEVMSQDEYIQGQTRSTAGRTVEGEEEVTALPSGPGVVLTSVSKRDIDALGSSDWLDTTHAMLPGE